MMSRPTSVLGVFEEQASGLSVTVKLSLLPQALERLTPDDPCDKDCACVGENTMRPGTSARRVPRVFISYAREDRKTVLELYQKLHAQGFEPWLDEKEILVGEDWELAIEKARRDSDFFLMCLSMISVEKIGYIQKEWKRALDHFDRFPPGDVFLLPVRLDNCEVPLSLEHLNWANYFEPSGFERLCRSIVVVFERRTGIKFPLSVPTVGKSTEPRQLRFANRDYERSLICNPGSPELIVLNAPAGFGKSRLLSEAITSPESVCASSKWKCALIALNNPRYKEARRLILDDIAQEITGQPLTNGEPQELIAKIAAQRKCILILFDGVEQSPDTVKWLQEQLVNPLRKTLKTLKECIGRFVFAGRYILYASEWDCWREYKAFTLTPLREHIVRQAVSEYLAEEGLDAEVESLLAKEVTYLSCGHPGIVSSILANPPQGGWAFTLRDRILSPQDRQSIFREHAHPVISAILSEISDDSIAAILEVISIPRGFHFNTIHSLQSLANTSQLSDYLAQKLAEVVSDVRPADLLKPFVGIGENEFVLTQKLLGPGFFSKPTREKPFYHDSIVRKLLLARLELEEDNSRYFKLNALAYAIYESWLDDKDVDGSVLALPVADEKQRWFMVESFYHFLICLKGHPADIAIPEVRIRSQVKQYSRRLRSSFQQYTEAMLWQDLKEEILNDEDVMPLLKEILGEEKARAILD